MSCILRAKNSDADYTQRMKRVVIAALPLVLLTACGSGGSSKVVTKTVTAPTSHSSAAAPSSNNLTPQSPSVTAEPSSVTQSNNTSGGALAFGQTFTSSTGRKVTISKPVPYHPGDSAALDTHLPAGTPYWKVTISLDNSSNQSFDTTDLLVKATSGETSVDGITDVETGIGSQPDSTLLPGHTVSWVEAYPVKPGTSLTVELDTMQAGTIAIWDGKIN